MLDSLSWPRVPISGIISRTSSYPYHRQSNLSLSKTHSPGKLIGQVRSLGKSNCAGFIVLAACTNIWHHIEYQYLSLSKTHSPGKLIGQVRSLGKSNCTGFIILAAHTRICYHTSTYPCHCWLTTNDSLNHSPGKLIGQVRSLGKSNCTGFIILAARTRI